MCDSQKPEMFPNRARQSCNPLLCVCTWYVDGCLRTWVHLPRHVWRSEVDGGCLPVLSATSLSLKLNMLVRLVGLWGPGV